MTAAPRRLPRGSGLLLHVTALPGTQGSGDLGPHAFEFVDFLASAGQSLWQVLPVGPTGYGNSPYQSLSAFAGNPLLVSLERLADEGWLSSSEIEPPAPFPIDRVDFDAVSDWRQTRLRIAFERFQLGHGELAGPFADFRRRAAGWLDDYALFASLKEEAGGRAWTEWPFELVRRDHDALAAARHRLANSIEREAFIQFQFDRQWSALRAYAQSHGVRVMGDIPIFVAHDSADVWANQRLFQLNDDGRPAVVAGVPPDYFSESGQLWGNPLYRWDALAAEGYAWWIERFRHAMTQFDLVRLDHFRGFEAYWEIPGDAQDARIGRWVPGPGIAFFDAAERALGPLPLVAEDLGIITAPVDALREEVGAPGMRVLQFAFGTDDKAAEYQPHNYPAHCVVYTGTHDNDTTVGWFHSRAGEGTTRDAADIERERNAVLGYLHTDGHDIAWDLLRLAWNSVADTAVAPLQDVLRLGSAARFNLPGTLAGNWCWRLDPALLTPDVAAQLRSLTEASGRLSHRETPTEAT